MSYSFSEDMSQIPNGNTTQYSNVLRPSMTLPKISFQYRQSDYLSAMPVISGISNASPCVITASGHGLSTGMNVTPSGTGVTSIDDVNHTITVVDSDNFELDGSDTTLDPAWVSGGTIDTPAASITVSVEGSVTGTDWVEIVAGVVDPVKSVDAPAWPYMRLKLVITNGNQDNYLFDVFEQPDAA